MDQGALVNEHIEAGANFLGQFQQSHPIQTAFWFKDSEERAWWLYVALDQTKDDNSGEAYGEVVRIGLAMHDPNFDLLQVKLIGEDHALAKAAAELRQRYPGRTPIRLQNRVFGGVSVEDVYIYPSPIPATVQL